MTIGADKAFREDVTLGLSMFQTSGKFRPLMNSSASKSDAYHINAYGAWNFFPQLVLQGFLGGGLSRSDVAQSSYGESKTKSLQGTAFAKLEYRKELSRDMRLVPHALFNGSTTRTPKHTLVDPSTGTITKNKLSIQNNASCGIGIMAEKTVPITKGWVFLPRIAATWICDLTPKNSIPSTITIDSNGIVSMFPGAKVGENPRTARQLRTRLAFSCEPHKFSLSLEYATLLKNKFRSHTFWLEGKMTF